MYIMIINNILLIMLRRLHTVTRRSCARNYCQNYIDFNGKCHPIVNGIDFKNKHLLSDRDAPYSISSSYPVKVWNRSEIITNGKTHHVLNEIIILPNADIYNPMGHPSTDYFIITKTENLQKYYGIKNESTGEIIIYYIPTYELIMHPSLHPKSVKICYDKMSALTKIE